MAKPLRIATIGVGDVAYRDYVLQMKRLAQAGQIDLLIARNAERLAKAAADFQVPGVASDWRAALGPQIDVALNLTPAPVHGKINLGLAQGGRHFYTEKPFANSVEQGAAIVLAAKKTGAVIAAAPSVMVYPQILAAASLLSRDVIGKVHSVRATATTPPPPWRGYHSDHGPFFSAEVGPMSDMGVYPLHAITGLLGDAVEVAAFSSRTRDAFLVTEGPFAGRSVPVDVDDNWQLILRLSGGILASVQVAYCIDQAASCHLEISGEGGTITLGILDPTAPLRVHSRSHGDWEEPVIHARSDGPDHVLGVADLLDSIRTGRDPVISARHALHVMAIRAAAETATKTGRSVPVQDVTRLGV